jgi:hypothetical protein
MNTENDKQEVQEEDVELTRYQKYKVSMLRWREANKDKFLETCARWRHEKYQENKEKYRQYQRDYYKKQKLSKSVLTQEEIDALPKKAKRGRPCKYVYDYEEKK